MQRYSKIDKNGIVNILSDMVIIPANKVTGEPARTLLADTPEYVAYAEQNGFALSDMVDNSLPTTYEIDAMTRGEKDEVLKKLVSRI